MDEPLPPSSTDMRGWWIACVLILPILVFIFIWVVAIGDVIVIFGAFFIIAIALAIFGIPLLIDDEYRKRFFNRLRRRVPPSEIFQCNEEIRWDEIPLLEVWPTIRSETGDTVSIPPDYDSSVSQLLPINVIQQHISELEAAVEELDANLHMIPTTYESPTRVHEQLLIERGAANLLLASLILQRGKKTIAPKYYTRKRRQLLRTIARIDEKIDELSELMRG
ncbi:MAG: hypothetical protein ACFFBR_04365 [Promethearchaeota archaeon]